ncbi:MAG TPA: cob(I)yrinic acid a,c-diamide adenosyltransferase [Longimicrobiales bacterium]|nr:cob(I)yrinic acid a,c-diamide adenosyltransferase [Longimicrobiales bacterium]
MTASRIYTRTGDDGDTSLFGGGRTSKAATRVDAYGEVDELNATLGWVLTQLRDDWIRQRLLPLQHDLFAIGAHLATPPAPVGRRAPSLPPLPLQRIAELEQWMDEASAVLPELRSFILPGGGPGGAALHVARTVCRRAERRVVALARTETVDPAIVMLLNRLSDFLFVAARRENAATGAAEPPWTP